MSYDHELDPIQRGSSYTFHVREARGKDDKIINLADGWTVRVVAKRWLIDSQPPLINRTGVVVPGEVTTANPNGWGAADVPLEPSDTANLLNDLPVNKVLLYWEIRATKGTESVLLDSGTVPIVRSVEAAA